MTEPSGETTKDSTTKKLRKCKTNCLKIETIESIIYDYHYGKKLKDICRYNRLSTTSIYNILKTERLSNDKIKSIKKKAKIQRLIDENNALIETNKKLIKELESI